MRFQAIAALGVFLAAGCGSEASVPDEAANSVSCEGGKCDSADGWIGEMLSGREDPIAQWLRTQTELNDTNGILTSDYQRMQFGVAEVQGCTNESATNFIISDPLIVESRPFPRLVGTVCQDDEFKNWRVFFSPPDPNPNESDLDVHTVEMFAWDAAARTYRFYRTDPVEPGSDQLEVSVEPDACANCHLAHRGLDATRMPMTPIMNELTQPWVHWNAQPGFESQLFIVEDAVKVAPHYAALTGGNWKGSARDLEVVIRNGHSQVASARARMRRDPAPASISATMSLLRPLFCDEQINYVSEAGTSGQLLLEAVVDVGLRELVKKKQPTGWGQKWMDSEARLRLSQPTSDAEIITMLPVRGSAMTAYESQITSVRAGVDVEDAIQIRLIDYQTPVFSRTRCGLWTQANERFLRESPDLGDLSTSRNSDIIAPLIREIMQVEGISLMTEEPGRYYVLGDGANLFDLAANIAGDAIAEAACDGESCTCDDAGCVAGFAAMVDVIEGYTLGVESSPTVREELTELRRERTCIATACYNNAPAIENLDSSCPTGCDLANPLPLTQE